MTQQYTTTIDKLLNDLSAHDELATVAILLQLSQPERDLLASNVLKIAAHNRVTDWIGQLETRLARLNEAAEILSAS